MTAITSQSFHLGQGHGLSQRLQEVLVAGLRLLSRLAQPSPATLLRRRRADAENVRHLARRWEAVEPGFAADLYAAAARHESLSD